MKCLFSYKAYLRGLGLVLSLSMSNLVFAAASNPLVTGPITGGTYGFPLMSTAIDIAKKGYTEKEYFIEGTATQYASSQPLSQNGMWNSVYANGVTAPYKTRILVRYPTNPRKFNGTVLVEWMVTTPGVDWSSAWAQNFSVLMNEGFAYVGVSASAAAVNNTGSYLPFGPGLKVWDPIRYGTLRIDSNDYSYDIFSQAGQAILTPNGANMLPGLKVKRLIATGNSASGNRITTYFNAVHPLVHVYNGFFPGDRATAALGSCANCIPPTYSDYRTDQSTPVLNVQSEAYYPWNYTQADSDNFVMWQVPGTAHKDVWERTILGADVLKSTGIPLSFNCAKPENNGPLHFVSSAALHQLNLWMTYGIRPPSANHTSYSIPGVFNLDAYGNVLGGVRTSYVDVPIATYVGNGNSPADAVPLDGFCYLFGAQYPLPEATLDALYPNHGTYVSKVVNSTLDGVKKGFLLAPDGVDIITNAANSDIGN